MPTRPPRSTTTSHHGTTSTRHSASARHTPTYPAGADRPIVGQAAGAMNIRDLVMDDVRTATRLARWSGVTATELKTEIDRGFHTGRGFGR